MTNHSVGPDSDPSFIAVSQLRIGMFVELELGWMAHPFPSGSFKISSERQIDVIRSLGLTRVRHNPQRSDPVSAPLEQHPRAVVAESASSSEPAPDDSRSEPVRRQHAALIAEQQKSLLACDRRFGEAIRQYRQVVDTFAAKPQGARDQCLQMVGGFVGELLAEGESSIRLLSEGMGDRATMHPINVMVLALLLGKSLNLPEPDMLDLGMAAFLHDIGKSLLPVRVRWFDDSFSSAEYKLYQDHVAQSVGIGQRMQLSQGTLLVVAQHHELVDGSGFPAKLKGDRISPVAKILALVNRYDNLCNPSKPSAAITPHEALALIFAQHKSRFDPPVLSAFIRMMGVYPPGSVVQLVDERFALVVSVNSSRPLKPRIIVYERRVPKEAALMLDLEQAPATGIRRSLKPSALPRDALDYLSPRQRMCYFFERAVDPDLAEPQP
jgi:HD-GYP domain-containing protein (c-di-GMP phosphodiesterase class II)